MVRTKRLVQKTLKGNHKADVPNDDMFYDQKNLFKKRNCHSKPYNSIHVWLAGQCASHQQRQVR